MLQKRQLSWLSGIWWVAWIGFHTEVLYFSGLPFMVSLADSTVSVGLLAVGSYVIWTILRFYRPGGERIIQLIVWCATVSAAGWGLAFAALRVLFASQSEYLEFQKDTLLVRYLFSFIMVACMGAVGWVVYFIQRQQEEQQRRSQTERVAREAELAMLRRQLQPHFLFNSLNSINALIALDPERAKGMVHQLSDFFRGSLRKDGDQQVNLSEEIRQTELYLDIEKVRFGHRLQTDIVCDEGSKSMMLPSLLLQPLIENAIKFGLYDTTGEVLITLKAWPEGGHLKIKICNPFDPATATQRGGSGFGLASVRRRLFLLYSRNDLVETQAVDNTYCTSVTIPQYRPA